MAQFVQVPLQRVAADTLQSMLEEYASRDGTDYGLHEVSLEEKTRQLRLQLERGELTVVYDLESEHWDLVTAERMGELEL